MGNKPNPLSRRWRLILPLGLILLGAAMLTGCIYFPWPHKPADPHQVDLSAAIGDRDSGKPIRLGFASKSAVVALLGPPVRESPDGRAIAYLMKRTGGTWIEPLCFYAKPGEFDLAVRLEFDGGGTLRSYQFIERENSRSEPRILGGGFGLDRDIEVFLDNIESPESAKSRLKAIPRQQRNNSPDSSRYETVPPP